jgi:thiosulfate reductase cytochrome b subunit
MIDNPALEDPPAAPPPPLPAAAIAHDDATPIPGGYEYRRHPLPIRILHWINVLALTILLMSGLNVFNSHPALYWGRSSYTGNPPVLTITAQTAPDGTTRGVTRIFGHSFDTTGVLGVSTEPPGRLAQRGFPSWLTIPDTQWLSMGRTWHLFFAWVLVLNGLVYVIYAVVSRHLARDLAPTPRDWRSIGSSIIDHLRFRHPRGEAMTRYNVLQKLAYLTVIFVLLPLTILMGLGMSPWANAVWPGWVDIVGGRQSARTIHFVCAWLIVAFVLIHVFEVLITGVYNNLRSMITGRYRVTGVDNEAQ